MADLEQRQSWGTRLGLILAMAGNAVGLGNFWRFPYQLGKWGGGAFLIPYFAALFLLGIPLMWIEWTMGRHGGKYGHGTEGPMVYLMARTSVGPRAAAIWAGIAGMLALGVTILLNSYYLHIVGWTLGYAYLSATGGYMDKTVSTGAYFVNYIQSPGLVMTFWVITLALLGIAVARGVSGGIEKWVSVMMPTLYVICIILIIRVLTLGAPVKPEWSTIKGLDYIWHPDWSKITFQSALAAAGQIFFTLSLGMGIINNYASYLKPDDDVVLSGFATVSLNEFAEVVLGGTIALPIAYAYMGPDGMGAGVGLSFISLPNIFRDMPGGQIWGALWFLLLFFAGYTSAIAMYNYLVALLEEDLKIKRTVASILVFLAYIAAGLPVALEPILTKTADLAYLTELDNWIGSYFLVVLGLVEVVVAAWLFVDSKTKKPALWDEMMRGSFWPTLGKWWFHVVMRWITPIYIVVLLVGTTINYYKDGYLKLVPSFVEKTPALIPWVNGARIVLLAVFILGFVEAYMTIKNKYADEIKQNKVLLEK
ncbi:sodium-dependent transporter [Coprothermobacteraceae bacterium]|nr:sodium-dependent transporter [Coprothermobacteraceae bacterium]